MNIAILAVDNDISVSHLEQAEWKKHGISTVRVDTMNEAIDILSKQTFLLVCINADNVNYLPLLSIMRDLSPAPIFVITSNFSVYDQVKALGHGAYVYASFHKSAEENVISALAMLDKYNEQKAPMRTSPRIIRHKSLLVSRVYRKAFYYDKEIHLTKIEFDLLCFLMESRGQVFSYEQIFRNVWGEEYSDGAHNTLWCHIRRLRKKLSLDPEKKNYIQSHRNVGYSFEPN